MLKIAGFSSLKFTQRFPINMVAATELSSDIVNSTTFSFSEIEA